MVISIIVASKVSSGKNGFKYFIGYKNAKKIRALCIFFPNMNKYRRYFNKTRYMPFLIKDNELLEKYN